MQYRILLIFQFFCFNSRGYAQENRLALFLWPTSGAQQFI